MPSGPSPREAPTSRPAAAGEPAEFLVRWHRALARTPPGPTVLFSGGLDSSLVAFCLAHLERAPTLVTVGTPGASDPEAARSAGDRLGLPLRVIALDPAALRAHPLRGVPGPGEGALRIALAAAIEAAPSGSVVCGQGADELFGGYAHFEGLSAAQAEARRRFDLHRLRHSDWPWTYEYARARGRRLSAPFLDWDVVELALDLRTEHWFAPAARKAWLRDVAAQHGLPRELAERRKRALQYGSGVSRALAR